MYQLCKKRLYGIAYHLTPVFSDVGYLIWIVHDLVEGGGQIVATVECVLAHLSNLVIVIESCPTDQQITSDYKIFR